MKNYRVHTLEDRFWSKVNKTPFCWEWTASLSHGYGQFMMPNRKLNRAHRVAWILVFGSIPLGLHVLHKCDNRKCVNPNHLFLGTNQDNIIDRVSKNRSWHPKTPDIICGHPTNKYGGNGLCRSCYIKLYARNNKTRLTVYKANWYQSQKERIVE